MIKRSTLPAGRCSPFCNEAFGNADTRRWSMLGIVGGAGGVDFLQLNRSERCFLDRSTVRHRPMASRISGTSSSQGAPSMFVASAMMIPCVGRK